MMYVNSYDVYIFFYRVTFMNRTQIYLSDAEKKALELLCSKTKRTKSSFIREALDFYLAYKNVSSLDAIFDKSYGCITSNDKIDRQEWSKREERLFY